MEWHYCFVPPVDAIFNCFALIKCKHNIKSFTLCGYLFHYTFDYLTISGGTPLYFRNINACRCYMKKRRAHSSVPLNKTAVSPPLMHSISLYQRYRRCDMLKFHCTEITAFLLFLIKTDHAISRKYSITAASNCFYRQAHRHSPSDHDTAWQTVDKHWRHLCHMDAVTDVTMTLRQGIREWGLRWFVDRSTNHHGSWSAYTVAFIFASNHYNRPYGLHNYSNNVSLVSYLILFWYCKAVTYTNWS